MIISKSFHIIICHRSNFNLELFLVVYLAPFNVFVCLYFVVFFTKKFNVFFNCLFVFCCFSFLHFFNVLS